MTSLNTIPPLLQRLYAARGITSPTDLELNLKQLLPPSNLGGITTAVELLATAIIKQQRIAITGDYDTDGATASTLCLLVLQALGAKYCKIFIPNRFTMGYGLAPELVEQTSDWGAQLIITVDSGVSSFEGVERARTLGINIIVTDHHLPGTNLPNANAIINPNLPGELFSAKNTAGVGVAFYLMSALRRHLMPQFNMASLLDLVALGTVADLVPLDLNNRIFVQAGLLLIRSRRCRPGILALLKTAGREPNTATAQDLGFSVAPRLNAAGRLASMDLGVSCLLETNTEQALNLAQELHDINLDRRNIEQQMDDEAEIILDTSYANNTMPFGLCMYNERWHQGVIGILASRLRERYHRPAIVLAANDDGIIQGSARSIPAVHIRDLLVSINNKYPNLLIRFGGHAMAAGLSLHAEQIDNFTQIFDQELRRHLNNQLPQAELLTDGQLSDNEITAETARLLRYAGPWGQGFPTPMFDGEFRVCKQRILKNAHLKLVLETETKTKVDAIFFRWGTQMLDYDIVRAVYNLDLNSYGGQENPQFILEYLEPA
ncbi:hypothetical protein TI04_03875 [Achromatium sp. WMS2]|nr:hypothetical protein TI04_03875 [Achromatium sp. WMS2]